MPHLTHVIALRPTDAQDRLMRRAAGCARSAYNWGLDQWKRLYRAGGKPNWMQLQKAFCAEIDQRFPFMRCVPSDAYAQPFRHLHQAFQRFFAKLGRHPRFKRKRRSRRCFTVRGIRWHDGYVIVPRIGRVRLCEPPRFPYRVVSATIAQDADRWTISVLFEEPAEAVPKPLPAAAQTVGIDLGLRTFATLSDGTTVLHPKPLRRRLKRLRRLNRRLARRRAASKRRERTRRTLARLHRRIRHIRSEVTHTTTTAIVKRYQTIVIEDLHVRGMLRNRSLAQAISEVAWHEFRRQLTYKCARAGRTLIVADRFFPSTKRCSQCCVVQDVIPLSERTFRCASCGFSADRDHNAALNLREYPCTAGNVNARGEQASVPTANGLHVPVRRIANPGAARAAKSSTETIR